MTGIFRAYDIRGLYPAELNEAIAEKIGAAFGTLIAPQARAPRKPSPADAGGSWFGAAAVSAGQQPRIAVGRDARTSSGPLHAAVIRGLLSTGARVLDIGEVPTPLLYFAVAHDRLDGGLMVTASHNPGDYNGIKPCGPRALCWSYESGGNKLEALVHSGAFARRAGGSVERKDVSADYIAHCKRCIRPKRTLKLVLDAGNGGTWSIAPLLYRALGFEVVELFCTPDGTFPNHVPDPLQKYTLKALQEAVPRERADLGIAFDGDGDRVGFVNAAGEIIDNNFAFALFIKKALRAKPGSKVLIEVLGSQMLDDVIRSAGGTPVVSRVGHTYIQELLHAQPCALGGETSAHYYFPENYNYDDGLFAGLKFAEIIANNEFAELAQAMPRYLTSDDTRLPCPDDKKFAAVAYLAQKFQTDGTRISTLDGVKVYPANAGAGSWFILRPSNTTPVIVLRWEARDRAGFQKVQSLALAAFKEACAAVGAPAQ